MFRTLLVALLIALALPACHAAADPCDYRQTFEAGQAGWDTFTCMAQNDATDLGPAQSVKVMVFDARTSPEVFYIPSHYSLHYEFAHARWPARFPDRNLFDSVMYGDPQHPHANATLVQYPDWQIQHIPMTPDLPTEATWTSPVTLQFFTSDAVPLDVAIAVYGKVKQTAAMLAQTGAHQRLIYIPPNAVADADARQHEKELAAAGVLWASEAELYAAIHQQSMNYGVTFGTLRNVSDEQLKLGALSYRDVIVLTRLPLNLPLVGGTITAEMQTPLAHVNVVAKARNTPNLALKDAANDPRVKPLLGKPVRFEVFAGGFDLREATPQEVNDYWNARLAHDEFVPDADLTVTAVRDLDELGFSSAVAYGVKAANYAELRQLWKQQAAAVMALTNGERDTFTEPGLGVPFAAYDRHVGQNEIDATSCVSLTADCTSDVTFDAEACTRAGKLCVEVVGGARLKIKAFIQAALERPDFQADSFLRAATLRGFRWAIEHTPVDPTFAAELDAAAWKRFTSKSADGWTTIKQDFRMRSSTNAEDLDGFTGAGLYESFTAQVEGSKSASNRIRKVWGSVWTFRAFEERSFWRIRHMAVHMGVLLNPNHPNEVSNGVAITKNLADPTSWGYYVNAQLGENSVTNPVGGITPEVFTLLWKFPETPKFYGHWQPIVNRLQFASLSPEKTVLDDPFPEYLVNALYQAQAHFGPLYGHDSNMALDCEWKVHPDANGKPYFLMKQIRPY